MEAEFVCWGGKVYPRDTLERASACPMPRGVNPSSVFRRTIKDMEELIQQNPGLAKPCWRDCALQCPIKGNFPSEK